jgi:hypothetical protein
MLKPKIKKPKSALAILKGARKLLDSKERWTKGCFAKDKQGVPVRSKSKKAYYFCLLGAINHCEGNVSYNNQAAAIKEYDKTYIALNEACGQPPMVFNDAPRRTHKQILKALDKAIKLAETEK